MPHSQSGGFAHHKSGKDRAVEQQGQQLFSLLDVDGDGSVDAREFAAFLAKSHHPRHRSSSSCNPSQSCEYGTMKRGRSVASLHTPLLQGELGGRSRAMPRDGGGRFPFFKAACYVQDAFDGVERVHPIELRPSVRWAQLLHLRAAPLFPYTRLAYVLLTLFEVPWWASGRTVSDDQLSLAFPMSGLPFVPYQYSNIFEALCLALLVLELAMQYQYQGAQQLVWARWPCVTAVLLVTAVVEAIITVQTQSIFAPFIRMGLIIAASDHGAVSLRRQLRLIYNIVQRFVPLAALSGVFLGAFAWAGMISFAGTNQAKAVQPDGTPFMWAFDSFSSAAWSLYVTFTSSNTPDVMMPAYNNNRFAAAYFLIFILSGVFFVSNFMLAIVYSEFKSEHTRVKQRVAGTKARHLNSAFRLISRPPRSDEGDHQSDRSGELHSVADQASLLCVFEELNLYSGIKYISNEKAAILFAMLDQSGDGLVYERDFGCLIDMLHMDFVKKQRQPWLLACANRSKSCCAHHLHRLQRAVNCHAFEVAVDALIVLNLCVLLFLTHRVYLHADATPLDVQGMPGWVPVFRTVTALFSLEIGLRATVNSWHDFWGQNYLNRYDSCVVLGMLACVTLLSYDDDHHSITRISILLQSARSWRPLLRIKSVRRASCVDGESTSPPRHPHPPLPRAHSPAPRPVSPVCEHLPHVHSHATRRVCDFAPALRSHLPVQRVGVGSVWRRRDDRSHIRELRQAGGDGLWERGRDDGRLGVFVQRPALGHGDAVLRPSRE